MEQKKSFVARMAVLVQRKPYLRYPVLAIIAGRLACYHFGRFLYSLRKKAALAAAVCGVVLIYGHTQLPANAENTPAVHAEESTTKKLEEPTIQTPEPKTIPEIQTEPWTDKEIVNASAYTETEPMSEVPASTKASVEDAPEAETEDESAESVPAPDVAVQGAVESNEFGWNLLLVNRSHPLTEDYRPQTRSIGYSIPVDVRIYDALKTMLNDGNRQGCSLLVCSGYRSYERQVELYEEDVTKYMRRGYSYEKACELTEGTLLPPGTSEHQAGLAVDIVATTRQVLDSGFENTREGKWLAAHAHEYGFILRYPKDKVGITQIEYEPWHFRYVGVEAAAEIHELGCCLEEYIDILKERAAAGEPLPATPDASEHVGAVKTDVTDTEKIPLETVKADATEVVTEPETTEPESVSESTEPEVDAGEAETGMTEVQPETGADIPEEVVTEPETTEEKSVETETEIQTTEESIQE